MSDADSVLKFIYTQHPYVYCASCIAEKLHLSEKDVHEALQVVALQPGFRAGQRVCYGCERSIRVVEVARAA